MKLQGFFYALMLLLAGLMSYAQSTNKFTINGSIKGIESGVIRMHNDQALSNVVDSAKIINGEFRMHGSIDFPSKRLFTIVPGNWSFQAIVENANLRFYIDTTSALNGKYYGGYPMIKKLVEKGSDIADQEQIFDKQTGRNEAIDRLTKLSQQIGSGKGEDVEQTAKKEIMTIGNESLAKQKDWIANYVRLHPSSVAGVYLYSEYNIFASRLGIAPSGQQLQADLKRFTGQAKESIFYLQLAEQERALRNIEVGSKAPDVILKNRSGKSIALSPKKNKLTLIDFWASWCVPCRAAIPHLKEMYAKYHSKGFEVFSVSGDKKKSDWIKALDKEKMGWPQVIDEYPNQQMTGRVSDLFTVKSIPYYVLLDKSGEVVLASENAAEIVKKITEILK